MQETEILLAHSNGVPRLAVRVGAAGFCSGVERCRRVRATAWYEAGEMGPPVCTGCCG